MYDIDRKNLKWFKSYLGNRKEYIQIDDKYKTDLLSVTCGVSQGSIWGPLLFLFYVNDLSNASKILDPTTFADNTSPILSNCDITKLFPTVNSELSKINQSFLANKISLNVVKTKYSFFHKASKKDYIPLKLPRLQINNYHIKRIPSIKFLRVLFHENLSW